MMYYRISKNEKFLFFGKKIAQVWAVTLSDYRDFQVCDLLEFGFPLGCSEDIRNLKSNTRIKNHKGAREFPSEIKSYLESELCKGTVLGPFKENPFQTQLLLSPLNNVPTSMTQMKTYNFGLEFSKAKHIEGGNNRLPDLLSRWELDAKYR